MLCTSGKHVFKGYYHEKEMTDEVMEEINGETYYVTGNIGFLDTDRYFTLIGRASRFFIINTLNKVYCELVQLVISAIDVVDSCAVVPIPNQKTLYKSKAYVVLKKGVPATADTEKHIIEASKKTYIDSASHEEVTLKDYEIPESVTFLDKLPRTVSAEKIDYEALKKMAEEEFKLRTQR